MAYRHCRATLSGLLDLGNSDCQQDIRLAYARGHRRASMCVFPTLWIRTIMKMDSELLAAGPWQAFTSVFSVEEASRVAVSLQRKELATRQKLAVYSA